MSKSIEEFLPEKKEYEKGSATTIHGMCEEFRMDGFNQCLSEASKVEIGLDRDKIKEIFGREIKGGLIADALLAAEDELIVKKEKK